MEYRVQQIDATTYLVDEFDEKDSVSMYLLIGTREAVLIDTGFGTIPLSEIVSSLTDLPVRVLLTHAHFDHAGAAGQFERVMLAEADLDQYRETREAFLAQGSGLQAALPESEKLEPVLCGKETEMMDPGDRPLELVLLPGHTQGCVCIVDQTHGLVYTGDCCCKADLLMFMRHHASLEACIQGFLRLKERAKGCRQTWPAHHEKPVPLEILDWYLELCQAILDKRVEGEPAPFAQGMMTRYRGKNGIAIVLGPDHAF